MCKYWPLFLNFRLFSIQLKDQIIQTTWSEMTGMPTATDSVKVFAKMFHRLDPGQQPVFIINDMFQRRYMKMYILNISFWTSNFCFVRCLFLDRKYFTVTRDRMQGNAPTKLHIKMDIFNIHFFPNIAKWKGLLTAIGYRETKKAKNAFFMLESNCRLPDSNYPIQKIFFGG